MNWTAFGETFVTLLVIMDPVGLAPLFISLTATMTTAERRRAGLRATLAAGLLVFGFAVFGEVILRYLNVSIASLSIAGGFLLLLLALEMLRGVDFPAGPGGDVALVPLASPLVAGPGAIATAIVLARQYGTAEGRFAVFLGILAAILVVGASLVLADLLARVVPDVVIHFVTRVLGLLLAAIGVQLILRGIHTSFG